MLSCETLTHRYPHTGQALRDVSFRIQAGEFVCLLGQSGCGKSTLLRLLAGLERPTTGQIDRRTENIAMVFQSPSLMPWADVFDNVYLPLRLAGQSRSQARPVIDEMLAAVRLPDSHHSKPAQLSGGMSMRVALARALVTRPTLLLMDEPFAHMDEITRLSLQTLVHDLWRAQNFTALMVTHSPFEAGFLSTRTLVMTPKPGTIYRAQTIDLPAERTDQVRHDPAYGKICSQLLELVAYRADS